MGELLKLEELLRNLEENSKEEDTIKYLKDYLKYKEAFV